MPRILAKPVAAARSMNLNALFPSSALAVPLVAVSSVVSRLSIHVIDTTIYARRRSYDFLRSRHAGRSICIHRSYGIKYTRHIHESDNCHSCSTDVSINRVRSFALHRASAAIGSLAFILPFGHFFFPLFASICASLFSV